MADWYHWLRDALRILPYPRSKSATEQNDFHGLKSRSSTTFGPDANIFLGALALNERSRNFKINFKRAAGQLIFEYKKIK